MNFIDPFIEEMKHESANTRKVLERIPEDKFGWKPHAKSMTFARLASHVAENPKWTVKILDSEEFSMDPASYKPWIASTRGELLKAFDDNVAAALKAMEGRSNEEIVKTWTFKIGGKTVFAMPRAAALRAMIFNHGVHHRGQLTVYLRLNDIPVPAIYGPSADES
jgi:uncharacterized damage-inducible protein DinB